MIKSLSFLFVFSIALMTQAQENTPHCSKRTKHSNSLKSATLSVAQIAETEKYDVHYYSLNLKCKQKHE
jgi:hypothetical protein